MKTRKIINTILFFSLFAVSLLGVASYPGYLYLHSPAPKEFLTFERICNVRENEKYGSTDIATALNYSPEIRATIDSGGSMTQKVSLNGWLTYYPVSEKFMLRDGLDFIILNLSLCKDEDVYREWPAVFVILRGELYADKNGAKVTVDSFESEVPQQFCVALGAGGASAFVLILIGIIWLLKMAIRWLKRRGKR